MMSISHSNLMPISFGAKRRMALLASAAKDKIQQATPLSVANKE